MLKIKRALLKYVRWFVKFREWVHRMEAIGLEDKRLQALKEAERAREMETLRQAELAKLREEQEAEAARQRREYERRMAEEIEKERQIRALEEQRLAEERAQEEAL